MSIHQPKWGVPSGVLLALALAALLPATVQAAEPTAAGALMGAVHGEVEIGSGEPPEWRAAQTGDALHPGELVRTGRGARAELLLDRGAVRLYENSLLRLPAAKADDTDSVELDHGSSIFDVIRRGVPFEVRTPDVIVSVKGTRFWVDLDGAVASVSVLRGTVGVRDPAAGPETLVHEGFTAAGGRGAPFELGMAPELDVWDAWQRGLRPVPAAPGGEGAALEGRTRAARADARRATAPQVLQHAARRNPEVARELRELGRANAGGRDAETGPAAPAADGGRTDAMDVTDTAREAAIVGRMIAEEITQRLADTIDIGGGSDGSGGNSGPGGGGSSGPGGGGSSIPGLSQDEIAQAISAALATVPVQYPLQVALSHGNVLALEDVFLEVFENQGFTSDQAQALFDMLSP
jgi:hypothetical protein